MKLTKRAEQPQAGEQGNEAIRGQGLTRRAFMVNSGLVAGGAVAAGWLAPAMMQRAEAKTVAAGVPVEVKRTICSHCSVGCGVYAEVQNGVWTGQEPGLSITPSTLAVTAPRGRPCASTATVSVASSTR